jgi:hypothetical protein
VASPAPGARGADTSLPEGTRIPNEAGLAPASWHLASGLPQ